MVDEKTKTKVLGSKLCQKFKWQISDELAKRTAVCRIETKTRKRRTIIGRNF
jgi:hypothetical protein